VAQAGKRPGGHASKPRGQRQPSRPRLGFKHSSSPASPLSPSPSPPIGPNRPAKHTSLSPSETPMARAALTPMRQTRATARVALLARSARKIGRASKRRDRNQSARPRRTMAVSSSLLWAERWAERYALQRCYRQLFNDFNAWRSTLTPSQLGLRFVDASSNPPTKSQPIGFCPPYPGLARNRRRGPPRSVAPVPCFT
jgi:hypothetical protein